MKIWQIKIDLEEICPDWDTNITMVIIDPDKQLINFVLTDDKERQIFK